MWSKINSHKPVVTWEKDGRTEVYDESGLRKVMVNFLSDKSRRRYGGENFMQEKQYLDAMEWFMQGLRLLMDKG